MSIKRGVRPTDIGAALNLGNLDEAISSRRAESKPRTAAGELLAERRSGLEVENARLNSQLGELQAEVQKWAGASPVLALDPHLVEPSRFANRLAESFASDDFALFREEIRASGGNVQPIKVAPIPGTTPQRYTIVFGHRRHRACLEEGLPVHAIVENLTESAQFVEMERENRGRRDLSAYEQGVWYLRACSPTIPADKGSLPGWGLFASKADLAAALGIDKGNVSKACQIAELPEAVLDAFPSRNEIQFNWATALHRAMKESKTTLIARANGLSRERGAGKGMSAKDVYTSLVAGPEAPAEAGGLDMEVIGKAGRAIAHVIRDKKGRTRVEFLQPLDSVGTDKLVQFLSGM